MPARALRARCVGASRRLAVRRRNAAQSEAQTCARVAPVRYRAFFDELACVCWLNAALRGVCARPRSALKWSPQDWTANWHVLVARATATSSSVHTRPRKAGAVWSPCAHRRGVLALVLRVLSQPPRQAPLARVPATPSTPAACKAAPAAICA